MSYKYWHILKVNEATKTCTELTENHSSVGHAVEDALCCSLDHPDTKITLYYDSEWWLYCRNGAIIEVNDKETTWGDGPVEHFYIDNLKEYGYEKGYEKKGDYIPWIDDEKVVAGLER